MKLYPMPNGFFDEFHISYLINRPEFSQNQDYFYTLFLANGFELPVPTLPGLHFHIPGNCIANTSMKGPWSNAYRYVFIAVSPEASDYYQRAHFSTQDGVMNIFQSALKQAGFLLEECYFVTAVRFLKPRNVSAYKMSWVKSGLRYIHHELDIIKPKAVCLLGSEVTKAIFGTQSQSYVRDTLCTFKTTSDNEYKAWSVISHFSFANGTAGIDSFIHSLSMFREAIEGKSIKSSPQILKKVLVERDYAILDTPEKIQNAVQEEIQRNTKVIAIDVETGTDTGRPEHSYIVSFQWSHGPYHARVIPFLVERPEPIDPKTGRGIYGGSGVDRKSIKDRVAWYPLIQSEIKKLLDSVTMLVGHNIRYDLSILRDEFNFPVRSYIYRGIFDTMQAYHLLYKDFEYGLKHLALKFTDLGSYANEMFKWVEEQSGPGKLFYANAEDKFFHQYRDVSYEYLLPYGMCDVDATMQIFSTLKNKLDQAPEEMRDLFYSTLMPLNSPVMDVERYGFIMDLELAYKLSHVYNEKYEQLVREFQEFINWPGFNPNSPIHVPALLFKGVFKNWKKCHEVRPSTAYWCQLQPVRETGKYGQNWDEIPEHEREFRAPSCEMAALKKILVSSQMDEKTRQVLEKLIEIKALKQFVSLFMRPPVVDPPASPQYPRYGKGLLGCVREDGRVCTRISLLSETHRWMHRSPNLANLPKTKEDSVKNIFIAHATDDDVATLSEFAELGTVDENNKLKHIPKVREMFRAAPNWKIIEADYKSAELWVMGFLSGDKHFCHVLEHEPDAHGYNAKHIFKLDCDVKDVKAKYPRQRFAAKAVCFGIAYGLSAAGLADQLSLEYRRPVPIEEAQEIIDGYFAQYPDLKLFFDNCKQEVERFGYVETPFGSRRYFPGFHSVSAEVRARMKREGMNAKIQGTVAIMLDKASVLLDRMRYDTEIGQKIQWEYCLGLHDAIYVHAPAWAAETTAEIVKWCMESIIIPKVNRNLQVDVSIHDRWSSD